MRNSCYKKPKSSSNKQNQVKTNPLKGNSDWKKSEKCVKVTAKTTLTMELYNKMTYNKLKISLIGT